MLTDRRQELVRARIATVNRLHDVLCQLTPGGARKNLRASTARRLLSTVRPRSARRKGPASSSPWTTSAISSGSTRD